MPSTQPELAQRTCRHCGENLYPREIVNGVPTWCDDSGSYRCFKPSRGDTITYHEPADPAPAVEPSAECPACYHPIHKPGACDVLHVYDRPGSPPGNQFCLCGAKLELPSTAVESEEGTPTEEEKYEGLRLVDRWRMAWDCDNDEPRLVIRKDLAVRIALLLATSRQRWERERAHLWQQIEARCRDITEVERTRSVLTAELTTAKTTIAQLCECNRAVEQRALAADAGRDEDEDE